MQKPQPPSKRNAADERRRSLSTVTLKNSGGQDINLRGKYGSKDAAILEHWMDVYNASSDFVDMNGVPVPSALIGDLSEVGCYVHGANETRLSVRDFIVEVSTAKFKKTIQISAATSTQFDGETTSIQISLPGWFFRKDFDRLHEIVDEWTDGFESIIGTPTRLLEVINPPIPPPVNLLHVADRKNRIYNMIDKVAVMEMIAHAHSMPSVIAHIRPSLIRQGDRTYSSTLTCTATQNFQVQLQDFFDNSIQVSPALRIGPFSYTFQTHHIDPGRYNIMDSDATCIVLADAPSSVSSEGGTFTPVDPETRIRIYTQLQAMLTLRGIPSHEQINAMCVRATTDSISLIFDFSKPFEDRVVWKSHMFQKFYGSGELPDYQTNLERLQLCIARAERTFTDPVYVKTGDHILKYNLIVRHDPSSTLVMLTLVPFSDKFAANQLKAPPSPPNHSGESKRS